MKNISLLLILLLMGCSHSVEVRPEITKVSRSIEMQQEIDALLAKDKANKQLELQYLEEIKIAEANQDSEAFKFYLTEYVKVERLDIPDWLKQEPNYFKGGLNIKY